MEPPGQTASPRLWADGSRRRGEAESDASRVFRAAGREGEARGIEEERVNAWNQADDDSEETARQERKCLGESRWRRSRGAILGQNNHGEPSACTWGSG